MQAGIDDDEPDTFQCYRHPDRETALRCNSCERPICVDCAVQGAVGIKCPECARIPRAARGHIPVAKLVRGIAAASILAVVLGSLLFIVPIPFLGIILAYVAGIGIGKAARAASGGYRDPALARAAALAAAVGILALPIAYSLPDLAGNAQFLFFRVLAAGAAAWAAFHNAA